MNAQMTAFTLRHPSLDDVPAIAALINAVHFFETGAATVVTEQRLSSLWNAPGIDVPSSIYIAHALDGSLVGFATCISLPPFEQIETEILVLPQARGQGLEDALLQAVIDHAHHIHLPQAAPTCAIVLQSNADDRATWQKLFLETHGFELVRGFWKMQIDFDGSLPAPTWPDGIEPRPYDPTTHSRAVYLAIEDAFADHWGFHSIPLVQWDFVMQRNNPDPSLWFIGWAGDEIAGFSICTTERPEIPDLGYVSDLGVRRQYRKLGLGLALLQHSFGEVQRRGKKGMSLHVDAENRSGATRLYERAGMHAVETSWKYQRVLREATPQR